MIMNDLGLSEYCVDIRTFDPNRLADTFESLVLHSDEIRIRMAERLTPFKSQLMDQFDGLFLPEVSPVERLSKVG